MFKFDDTLMTLVKKNLETGSIPMLLGEPGIGKSSWLEDLGRLLHTKVFILACNQLADKADLTGARLVPTGNDEYKQVFYPHATIHDAIEYALANPRETPILFLDELNRTTPDVTSEALSIPTMRSIGSKKLPDNIRVVIAGNDKGNITSLDEASVSRFVLYHVCPDVNTFIAVNQNLNPFVQKVLQAHPETIFCKQIETVAATSSNDDDEDEVEVSIDEILDDGEDMKQFTTPRTISAVSKFLNTFSNQELMAFLANTYMDENGEQTNALKEAIEGHVGRTAFSSFLLAEIATGIMTTNNQSSVNSIGKPQCYDAMKACPDYTTLNNFIATMSDNDKSGCIVYALYERVDNTHFINALAPTINQLNQADTRVLMQLASSDQLDNDNVNAFLATNTPLASALGIILETTN